MLAANPTKLKMRAGARFDHNRGFGHRDHSAIADQERRAGEVDATPDERHAVQLSIVHPSRAA